MKNLSADPFPPPAVRPSETLLTGAAFCGMISLTTIQPAEDAMITDHLRSSLLIRGDASHAFRDPAVFYESGLFHLFCTYVETEPSGEIFMYTVQTQSWDLLRWT